MRSAADRDLIECEGTVVEQLGGDNYTVTVEIANARRTVLAKRNGRLNLHRIKIVPGDRVILEISPFDLSKGRITRRL